MMSGRAQWFAIALAASTGCNRGDPLTGYGVLDAPSIPSEYPQIDLFEGGKAELLVDGVPLVTDRSVGATFDQGGLEPEELPVALDFDSTLYLEFVAPDPGTYVAADGDFTANWQSDEEFELDATCGKGTLVIVGESSMGGLVAMSVIWGTLILELCKEGEPSDRLEITGRFSSTVIEI